MLMVFITTLSLGAAMPSIISKSLKKDAEKKSADSQIRLV